MRVCVSLRDKGRERETKDRDQQTTRSSPLATNTALRAKPTHRAASRLRAVFAATSLFVVCACGSSAKLLASRKKKHIDMRRDQ